MSIIVLIFDYDDTLVPDSTTQLLEKYKIDTEKFWGEDFKKLIQAGFDPTFAMLKLIFENIGKDKPLGLLTNSDLRKIDKEISQTQFPGLPEPVC